MHPLRRLLRDGHPLARRCRRSFAGAVAAADGVVKSPHGQIDIPAVRLHEAIYDRLGAHATRIAVECGVTGRSYTYAKMREASRALAASLQNKFKMSRGSTAALLLPNLPEYPIVFLGGSEAGVVLTTINSTYREAEVARQIEASGATVIFTTPALHSVAAGAVKLAKKEYPIVVIKDSSNATLPDGSVDFFELIDPGRCCEFKPVATSPEDVVVLPYSSGTTGLPKGVQLVHRNVVANIIQINNAKIDLGVSEIPEEKVLGLLPMFHIYGMSCVAFSTLQNGGTLLTVPKFDPASLADYIKRKKMTTLYLVPPVILFMINSPTLKPGDLDSVRYLINGASPIGHKDMERFLEKNNHVMVGQGYGMTETSPVVLLFRKRSSHKYGSIGVPVASTEVKIMDPDALTPQPANRVGEIWVRGPQVMKGYLNNQKATDEMVVEGGWLRTGDLGYYDDDGDFFISDRMKDLIKVKGYQVAPAELEELLRTHPAIVDAAVIGVPDAKSGEAPRAFVVFGAGKTASEAEIKAFIAEKVSRHKELTGGVVVVKEIPKSAAGKILKMELRAMC